MKSDGILSKVDPDLVIQEALYGFIMALTLITTAQIGLVHYDRPLNLILAIIGMDVVWGLIDMYIFYRVDLTTRDRNLRLYQKLRLMKDRRAQADALSGEFDGTIFELASPEDKDKMIDVFLNGRYIRLSDLKRSNRHYLFNAITAFVSAVLPVIPSVICLWFIEDYHLALFCSSLVSSIAIFFVGFYFAPGSDFKVRVYFGFSIMVICLFFTVVAAAFGG